MPERPTCNLCRRSISVSEEMYVRLKEEKLNPFTDYAHVTCYDASLADGIKAPPPRVIPEEPPF